MPRELQMNEVELANSLTVDELMHTYGHGRSLLLNDGLVTGIIEEKKNPQHDREVGLFKRKAITGLIHPFYR